MYPALALLTFILSVILLGRQQDYQGLGFGALSIAAERNYRITEKLWPPGFVRCPVQNVFYPKIEYRTVLEQVPPVPTRVLGLGPPLNHPACNVTIFTTPTPCEWVHPFGNRNRSHTRWECYPERRGAFKRACPTLRPLQRETRDVVVWHDPNVSGQEPIDVDLFLGLGMLVISVTILGCGAFWDRGRPMFAHLRGLARLRFLHGDERLDGKSEGHDDREQCTAKHWDSNIPPLQWIDQFTSLQREYSKMKAKNDELRARTQRKRVRVNELAWKNIFLRREKLNHAEVIQGLCVKLREVDNNVFEMRQFFKMAMVFERIESEEDKVAWEAHQQKHRLAGVMPLFKEIWAKPKLSIAEKQAEYYQLHGVHLKNWRRKPLGPVDKTRPRRPRRNRGILLEDE